jgi:exodeoxyribonuclease VII large subunit
MLASVGALASRWRRGALRVLEMRIQRVDGLARRLVHPAARMMQQRRDAAGLAGRLARACRNRLATAAAELVGHRRRLAGLLRQPLPHATRLAPLVGALSRAGAVSLERRGIRIAALGQSLAHLNPRAVLERGYAIVTTTDGVIVDDAARLAVGDDVTLTLGRGEAGAKITRSG